MYGDFFVAIFEPVLLTPHGVSRRGAAIEFVGAVLEAEPDVDVGMLGFDPQVLGPVGSYKASLCFHYDVIG